MNGKVYIGTSGFHYKHWMGGTFYPEGMKSPEFMSYYKKFFKTVELNNPFYRLPPEETFRKWRKESPDDFLFSVKASRYITHMKRLKEGRPHFERFINNAKHLEEKLGPILFQLPPSMKINTDRLKEFTDILHPEYRYTFEFRNDTWYNNEVYKILENKNISFCIYELEYHMSPVISTADFVYIRLHGPDGKYTGSYTDEQLSEWGDKISRWSREGKDVYMYFDNDDKGFAPHNADKLIKICQEKMKEELVIS